MLELKRLYDPATLPPAGLLEIRRSAAQRYEEAKQSTRAAIVRGDAAELQRALDEEAAAYRVLAEAEIARQMYVAQHPPAVIGVEVLSAGPEHRISARLVAQGEQEGWLAIDGRTITIKGAGGDVTYTIRRAPGRHGNEVIHHYDCVRRDLGDDSDGIVRGDHNG